MVLTRTKRWVVIAFALAIPFTTVWLIHRQPKTANVDAGAVRQTSACVEAAKLVPFDREAAISRFRTIRDANSSSGADRVCAAAELVRLEPPTIADRTFLAAQSVINWVSHRVTGTDARLSASASGPLLGALFVIEALALIVAIGQFVLWRSERWPGPVAIVDVVPPTDDTNCDGLAQIIKDRLARAGVPPGTDTPGVLAAVVVNAVDSGVGTSAGWPAQLLQGLVSALRPSQVSP